MFANCQKPLQKKGPKLSAFWILVGKLRPRLGELPRDHEITATSTSIAAPAGASISQRESFFRTDSRPGTSQAECSSGALAQSDLMLWRGRAARSQRIAGGARLGTPQLLGKLALALEDWLGGKR